LETFDNLESKLLRLERRYVKNLREDFACPAELKRCITGQVQFGAVDPRNEKSELLPVIVIIGINYTNDKDSPGYKGELSHYLGTLDEPVVRNEPPFHCVTATALAVAAYNRNASNWEAPEQQLYDDCEIKPYAAPNATRRSDLTGTNGEQLQDKFHLILTNFCPFITRLKWGEQASKKETPEGCALLLRDWSSDNYLDSLYESIGESVDLWIGHAAKDGTRRWVWPRFMDFVHRHEIDEWFLTPNISFFAINHFDRTWRVPRRKNNEENKLFQLFGPEKASATASHR